MKGQLTLVASMNGHKWRWWTVLFAFIIWFAGWGWIIGLLESGKGIESMTLELHERSFSSTCRELLVPSRLMYVSRALYLHEFHIIKFAIFQITNAVGLLPTYH